MALAPVSGVPRLGVPGGGVDGSILSPASPPVYLSIALTFTHCAFPLISTLASSKVNDVIHQVVTYIKGKTSAAAASGGVWSLPRPLFARCLLVEEQSPDALEEPAGALAVGEPENLIALAEQCTALASVGPAFAEEMPCIVLFKFAVFSV